MLSVLPPSLNTACDGVLAHTSANGTMCRPGSAAAGADGGRPITSPRRKASAISASAASTAYKRGLGFRGFKGFSTLILLEWVM